MATILQILNADRSLSLFNKGLKATGLDVKMSEIGPFTILGPVNLALGRLMSPTYEQLLEPANSSRLMDFLMGYILTGKKMLSDFRHNQQLPAMDGKMVLVDTANSDVRINGSKILARDRQGSNGVIHLLDTTYNVAQPVG